MEDANFIFRCLTKLKQLKNQLFNKIYCETSCTLHCAILCSVVNLLVLFHLRTKKKKFHNVAYCKHIVRCILS